jgi:hypothetical protein
MLTLLRVGGPGQTPHGDGVAVGRGAVGELGRGGVYRIEKRECLHEAAIRSVFGFK